jgi:hypothetical protein
LQIQVLRASTSREIEAAFAALERADALFIAPDAFFASRRVQVGASPTRQPLQPEATGAVMEVTKWGSRDSMFGQHVTMK